PARHILRGGELCKEGFRSVAIRNRLNETMPLVHPVVPATALTFFLAMHTGDREITPLTPAQSTSQSLPKLWIKKRFFCEHDERGFVIFPFPHGVFAIGSLIQGVHPVRTVDVIAPFDGFIYYFLDHHRCSLVSPPLRG